MAIALRVLAIITLWPMARKLFRSMAPYPCEKEFLENALAVLPDPPEYPVMTLLPTSISFTHLWPCRPPCLFLSIPGSQDSGLYPLLEHCPPGESTTSSLFPSLHSNGTCSMGLTPTTLLKIAASIPYLFELRNNPCFWLGTFQLSAHCFIDI